MPEPRLPRAVLLLVAVAAFTIAIAGLRAVSGIAGPTFLALILTITVHPLRTWLRGHLVPEWVAAVLMVLTVYVTLALLTLSLVVSVGRLAALVPTYGPRLTEAWGQLSAWLADRGVGQEQVSAVASAFDLGSLVSVATDILGGLIGVLSDLFFIAVLVLFMAFDSAGTSASVRDLADRKPDLVSALAGFTRGTRRYMAVSAGFGAIVAVIDTVALAVIGVPGAFVWGVLAFVTNFIPNIGFVIGVVPPAVVGLLEGGLGMMLAVIVLYSVINVVIQTFIQPRIVGDAVGLSATMTMLSLVFWAWAMGALGALLAVPLSLLLKALLLDADPGARWALPLATGKATRAGPRAGRSAGRQPAEGDR